MNLTAFAVRRWQATLVGFLLLAVLGVSAFLGIPRSVDPHFPISTVVTTVILPGADAADMEETVAKPLNAMVVSAPDDQSEYQLSLVRLWRANSPVSAEPYYYEAMFHLSRGRHDEFIRNAEHSTRPTAS